MTVSRRSPPNQTETAKQVVAQAEAALKRVEAERAEQDKRREERESFRRTLALVKSVAGGNHRRDLGDELADLVLGPVRGGRK